MWKTTYTAVEFVVGSLAISRQINWNGIARLKRVSKKRHFARELALDLVAFAT